MPESPTRPSLTQAIRSLDPAVRERRYVIYLVVVALLGWALASYDTNLLTLTLSDIAKDLGISSSQLGVMGFFIYGAEFVLALFVGWIMDSRGRKFAWVVCLVAAGVFTGLTFFVQDFTQLVIVRALASGFANAELAVSVTLVNEQVPSQRRGFLYSIVQSGYTVGVFMASGMYLIVGQFGWRAVFLFGIIPLILVAIARTRIRESDRFLHLKALRVAVKTNDSPTITRLQAERHVDLADLEKGSFKQLFAVPGVVRSRIIRLSITWLLYAMAYVASNNYISYWMTNVKGWTSDQVAVLLLVAGAVGVAFYLFGGFIGERFGRKSVLVWSAVAIPFLATGVLVFQNVIVVAVLLFLLYQASNGTWSGVGYTYQAEVFPTRVRALAVGWMSAMLVGGFMLGSVLWGALTATLPLTTVWIVIAVGLGAAQAVSTFFLPHIESGKELEELAA
ncbi:hypothetical protein DEI92_15350 [Curtobacterium sp. MCBD17_034]|uniref:MFS transporter n=1 Tax=unclassified Curtobacterium TaxID=257496 RepID=UPI000DAAD008|nr:MULTISPECIES: MFS transporter [unclassified Curtobacterium]PZF56173.1 hypothetical protein DEI92_15350 [Curtobacterium sp. MCBD17_034]PZM32962.1 hypothetical protein DEI90_15240 [Curtobacterium sp. MCBD17_031]